MDDLINLFKKYKVKKLLAIFPHPDDESFVSGGLFQIAQKTGIDTKLICLTKGEKGLSADKLKKIKSIREKELYCATKVLSIDEVVLWDYPDAGLKESKDIWSAKLLKEIKKDIPDVILTFDYSGITGHPDHIILSAEIVKILENIDRKPIVLWRIPDSQEYKYFSENEALVYAEKPDYKVECSIFESLRKIEAIFCHKSQMKSFKFKLQILEWFLFDHQELYYKVDLSKKRKYKIVFFKEKS